MEEQIRKIEYLGKEESLVQYLSESNEQYLKRTEIIKKMEKDNIPWKECLKLSKIYYNVKFRKCRYVPALFHKIKNYL